MPFQAVGHRVVQGGEGFRNPIPVTPEVEKVIDDYSRLAPLHNPANLAGIRAAKEIYPTLPHIAVFDTAFHSTLPQDRYFYGLPYEFYEKFGIRRYGFHGSSHAYVARRTAQLLHRPIDRLRIISCHLGAGASLTAIKEGRSVDTTMGFTPMEGVMMGTRCGNLDPGVVLWLLEQGYYKPEELDRVLNRESGLKGLSGVSGDLRDVLQSRAEGNARADLAFRVYVHRIRRSIGSMATSLGGVDVLAFTAGAGENSAELRSALSHDLGFLGLYLDEAKNWRLSPDCDISADGSPARILVIHTREDVQIAHEVNKCLAKEKHH
jgi:acetate kinase